MFGTRPGITCLALKLADSAFINEKTGLRNIEEMQMAEVIKVRNRIDLPLAVKRIESIKTPILVMGRDEDHLQGIFRTSYDLLVEGGRSAEWISCSCGTTCRQCA